MEAFGPVPSRRLGRSLGINNIPPKVCTYACVYCQLGRTAGMRVERHAFYDAEAVARTVGEKVEKASRAGEKIDYLAFVPDGEPTLDVNLGREIELLLPVGIPVAVISNASLIWREDVREDLARADWVSLKVDCVVEDVWRAIDRPHGTLRLQSILEGMLRFKKTFAGTLVTETMLVSGLNDGADCLRKTADLLARLRPAVAYLSVPTRPPAEGWAQPASEEALNRAYQTFAAKLDRVEYLVGYEGNAFAYTGDVEDDLLSVTAVHPMREDAVGDLLARAGASWAVVSRLIDSSQLVATEHGGAKYYLRRFAAGRHQ